MGEGRDSRIIIDQPSRSIPASGLATFKETLFQKKEPRPLEQEEVKRLEAEVDVVTVKALYDKWTKKERGSSWDPTQ